MKKKILFHVIVLIVIIAGFLTIICMLNIFKGYRPNNGIVPDEATAIKIAEAVWLPVYGDDIYTNQPFIAEYNEKTKTWYVHGTLPDAPPGGFTLGGVPEIRIKKADGKIVYIGHGK